MRTSVTIASVVFAALTAGCSAEDTSSEFEPAKADGATQVVIGADGDGKEFEVVEGQDIVVELAANQSTGYSWVVTNTNRTFGYPIKDEYEVPNGPVGGGGLQVLTWVSQHDAGPNGFAFSLLGTHRVELSYQRGDDVADTFSFTVNIVEASATEELCFTIEEGRLEYVHKWQLAIIPDTVCLDEANKRMTIGGQPGLAATLDVEVVHSQETPNLQRRVQVLGGNVQGVDLDLASPDDSVTYELSLSGGADIGYLNVYEKVQGKAFETKLQVVRR